MMHWTFGFLVFILFSWGINQQNPELTESIQRGEGIYEDFCITCHRANGKGFGKMYPPLAGSDFLLNKREESIRAVKYGLSGEITVNDKTYNKKMEPLGLSDKEVADVMNFILNSWGNTSEKMVTVEEVEKIVKN
ncbi:MAG: cytochrome c [Saprospiraceae bacterium]|nr:cytochrome c [Saprospiraceae bacterium]